MTSCLGLEVNASMVTRTSPGGRATGWSISSLPSGVSVPCIVTSVIVLVSRGSLPYDCPFILAERMFPANVRAHRH
jgi:hypothetical protein